MISGNVALTVYQARLAMRSMKLSVLDIYVNDDGAAYDRLLAINVDDFISAAQRDSQPDRVADAGEMVGENRQLRAALVQIKNSTYLRHATAVAENALSNHIVDLNKMVGGSADTRDAARYRAFFDAGLPITYLGVEYRSKTELDAAIDAIAASREPIK